MRGHQSPQVKNEDLGFRPLGSSPAFVLYLTNGPYVCVLSRFNCNPVDCSPPGSLGFSVHGILQAGILEWVAMRSSWGSFQPRDWTCISWVFCTAGEFFTAETSGEQKWEECSFMFCSLLFFFFQMSKKPSLWYVSEEQAIFRVKSTEKYADGSVNVRRV